MIYGAVEAGGTKFICALGASDGTLVTQSRIEVTDPGRTLEATCEFFHSATLHFGPMRALGIGSFGPLELRRHAARYGFITTTPKPGWRNTDLAGALARALQVPVALDTDVNAAALAELAFGAGRGLASVAYITVGTGIGAGIVHDGRPVHGLLHPEVGHIRVQRHPEDGFTGICSYHRDCLEGLACGPAVKARLGYSLQDAAPEDPVWNFEADYLGQLCATLVLTHSPERILMGGGVMHQARLLPMIRERMLHWLGGYVESTELTQPDFIQPPGLGDFAGIKGALILATRAAQ